MAPLSFANRQIGRLVALQMRRYPRVTLPAARLGDQGTPLAMRVVLKLRPDAKWLP